MTMLSRQTTIFRAIPPLRVPCRNKVSGSSKAWLSRHINDPYVKLAERDDNRSRAAYKFQEIQDKHKIVKPSDFVIDLGAAPGGWSVMVSKILNYNKNGLLVSIDLLDMEPIPTDVENNRLAYFIKGNFNAPRVREVLKDRSISPSGEQRLANVVLSDMLMNTSGTLENVFAVEQSRTFMYLKFPINCSMCFGTR